MKAQHGVLLPGCSPATRQREEEAQSIKHWFSAIFSNNYQLLSFFSLSFLSLLFSLSLFSTGYGSKCRSRGPAPAGMHAQPSLHHCLSPAATKACSFCFVKNQCRSPRFSLFFIIIIIIIFSLSSSASFSSPYLLLHLLLLLFLLLVFLSSSSSSSSSCYSHSGFGHLDTRFYF